MRDNDLVYVQPVPPATQLSPIVGAGMVKLATPTEVADPVGWLMGGGAGQGPLFSALVPYGVHLALSAPSFIHRPLSVRAEIQAYTTTAKTRWSGSSMGSGKSWTVWRRGESAS